MKHPMRVAAMVAPIIALNMVLAGMNLQGARNSRPADVVVYVEGEFPPPGYVDSAARATVNWMYSRIGVRINWRFGRTAISAASGNPVVIRMRYANDNERHLPLDSLAFSLPFANGTTTIAVMYNRIQFVTDRPARQQAILAHVLAHEIGHILQRTDLHVPAGVMKAHWDRHDYDAMEKKPLEFTPDDVDLIVEGLKTLKSQAAGEHPADDILRLSARENTDRLATAGKTGKELPAWVIAGVKALVQEVPSLPNCPPGYTVTINDIIFVEKYRDLEPVLSPAQYQFTASRSVPAFLAGHHFPLVLVGESPDIQFIRLLIGGGMADQAILLAKALLAHEVMHAWFDPGQGMNHEEFERSHEVAAYELQLTVLKRDLAAGRYAAMYARLNSGSVELTMAIEERRRALKAGEPMQKFYFLGTPLKNSRR